jgi:predicted RNA-binding protein YlqC (UPF0109 family)
MKKLLQYLVENIVKHPENVKIEEQMGENNWLLLHLSVHPEDMGQVIGRGGKIIKALRQILHIKALKDNLHFSLDLKEVQQVISSEGSLSEPQPRDL